MSWPQWPAGVAQPGVIATPQLPGVNAAASVLNPSANVINSAPAVLPPGIQYSPDQWAQMQQQNWQQWAQWQQQYQQWHQQYGAEFQKSMNALTTTAATAVVQQQPPLPAIFPNTNAPPPLPAENKPPLPPGEPPIPVQITPQNSFNMFTTPPPSGGNYNTSVPPPKFNQPSSQPKPTTQNWQSQNNNRNQNYPGNQFNQQTVKRQGPNVEQTKRPFNQSDDFLNSKRSRFEQQQPSNFQATDVQPRNTQNAQVKPNPEELSEAEKKFDKQFAEWEAQFNKWKEQNAGHPDKEQYKEYEKKWETWRAQLLERREQMRRKRLSLASSSPINRTPATSGQLSYKSQQIGDNNQQKISNASNSAANLLKPPPSMNNEPLEFKGKEKDFELMGREQKEKESESTVDKESGFLSSNTIVSGIPGLDLVRDDEKPQNESDVIELDSARNEKKIADMDAISKGINSILGDQKLLNMLSLVSQNQNLNINPINTATKISNDEKVLTNDNSFNQSANSCQSFGEQSNQENESFGNLNQRESINNFDDQTRSSFTVGPSETDQIYDHNNLEKNIPAGFTRRFENKFSEQNPVINFDNRFLRSDNDKQFNTRAMQKEDIHRGEPNDIYKSKDNFRIGSENFNRNIDSFNRGPPDLNKPFDKTFSTNFNKDTSDSKFNRDNFNKPDGTNRDVIDNFNKGPENFNRGSENFSRRVPGNFNREADNFNRRPDNLNRRSENRDSDNFNRGPDNFNRGPDNFNRGPDNFNRGPDNFNRGPDNFNRGPDNFNRGPDNFNRGPDSFNRGPDCFNRGPDNFNRGPDNFNRGPDNFNRGPDNFSRGPDSSNKGPDFNRAPGNLNRGPDSFNRNVDNGGGNLDKPPGLFNRGSGNFGRGVDNFNRGINKINLGPDFNRGMENTNVGPNNLNRPLDQFNKVTGNINRGLPAPNFGRIQNKESEFGRDLNRGGMDGFDRGQNIFGKCPSDFSDKSDADFNSDTNRSFNFEPPPLENWSSNFADEQNSRFSSDSHHLPENSANIPYPNISQNIPRADNKPDNEGEDILKPATVIEYDHKALKPPEPEISIEPIQTFDYRHKPLNRIPLPQRPKWLNEIVKNYREFDPLATRQFEQLRRYPSSEKYDPYRADDRRKIDYDERRSYGRRFDDQYYDKRKPYEDKKYFDDKRGYSRSFEPSSRKDEYGRSFESPPHKYEYDRNSEPLRKDDYKRGFELPRRDDYEDKYKNENKKRDKKEHEIENEDDDDDDLEDFKGSIPHQQKVSNKNVTLIEDLLNSPERFKRPPRIVIILRGPPGSGKTFLAKLIKDKEVENGGSAPRILSLDDYFMVEQEKEVVEDGKRIKIKDMVYEYEECMEPTYRTSLMKSFKKTVTDGLFSFIIVDNVNDKVKYFGEMWSFAKQNGFQVYICQLELDVQTCSKRNIHERSEADIEKCVAGWEPTPAHHPTLDATSLIQSASIVDVEMEEINSPSSDDLDSNDEDQAYRSKWDNFDCSIDNLAKLDGISKPLRPSRTMEDYLQLEEWTATAPTKPGQKRVRWADLEERKEQEKMRAIGFVVGQTDWNRMMDPTLGSGALTQTKYIERVGRY